MVSGVNVNGFPLGMMNPNGNHIGLVGFSDAVADVTGQYPMIGGGLYNPMMGGSIMPFMGGMGTFGYGPGSEYLKMDTETAMDYQNRLRYKQLEGGVELSRKTADANFRVSARNKAVGERIAILYGLIKENNQDQIPSAYDALVEAVKEKIKYETGKEANHEDADVAAKTLYAEAMKGRNIGDDLHKYGDSPFIAGAKKATAFMGWAFMDTKTSAQNIAAIEGTRIPASEKAKEMAGKVVAGVLSLVGFVALWKSGKSLLGAGTTKALVRNASTPVVAGAAAVGNVATDVAKALTPEQTLANLKIYAKELEQAVFAETNHPVDILERMARKGSLGAYVEGTGVATHPKTKEYIETVGKIAETETFLQNARKAELGLITPPTPPSGGSTT